MGTLNLPKALIHKACPDEAAAPTSEELQALLAKII
jgi:hypothetical protein